MNFMNYKKTSIVMVGAFLVAPLYGSIEVLGQWILETDSGKKEIVVIGNYHIDPGAQDRKRDNLHKKMFLNLLDDWKSHKILFLLDATKENFENIKKDFEGTHAPFDLMNYLCKFSETKKMKFDNIEFKWADCRSAAIHEFLDAAITYQEIPLHELETFKKHIEKRRPHLKKGKCNQIELDLKASMQSIDTFVKSYSQDSSIHQLLTNLKKGISEAHAALESVKKDKKSKTLSDHILHLYMNLMGTNKANSITNALMFQLPAAGYIQELEKNKNKYDRIVLFVGQGQIRDVNTYLREIGAKCIQSIGEPHVLCPKDTDTNQIFEILKKCFVSRCIVCAQPSDFTCLCKKPKYCSRKCQVEDWPVHKLECKPHAFVGCKPCAVCKELSLFTCGDCKAPKYCTKACQVEDWENHKLECKK